MIEKSKRYSRYFTYIEPVIKAPLVKTYGSLLTTIIALIVFILFAIKPTIETITILQKDLSNQKDTLAKISQKTQDLTTARANYQNIDQSIKTQIEIAVPKNSDLSKLIKSLEDASKVPQASISAIQFQPVSLEKPSTTVTESKLLELNFTYNVEGRYESLKLVLDNLRKSPRLISITSLVFNKTEGGNLLMSITGKAYYLN